ncbi:MAG: hypothetical protein GEU99_12005 [Luteitalea sp.]|nr:hypothetical protein [Luteitalea sp.]
MWDRFATKDAPEWRGCVVNTEGEWCGTDREIGERNHDAGALLPGIQLGGKPGNVSRQRRGRDPLAGTPR